MIDIISMDDGLDFGMLDTQLKKAENILSTQLGTLEYAPDFGVDLKYFLDEKYQFQDESFKAYLIQRLANSAVNVSGVTEVVESLSKRYIFNIGNDESGNGLVSR